MKLNLKLSVRCYTSGRRVRCICFSTKEHKHIISLEEDFNMDGGLNKIRHIW